MKVTELIELLRNLDSDSKVLLTENKTIPEKPTHLPDTEIHRWG